MLFLLKLLDVLLPPRTTRALVEGATLETLGTYVSPASHRLATTTITSLLPYRVPLVRALVKEAKYHHDIKAIALLGAVLADYLLTYAEDRQFDTSSIVIVPVPLGSARLRERGHNQVESIARAALQHLPERFSIETKLITRIKETAPQARLSRSNRLTNMTQAFAVTGDVPTKSTVIFLDDVATTGSTLAAMEAAIGAHDFSDIHTLSIAH